MSKVTRESIEMSERIDIIFIIVNMFLLFISGSAVFLGYTAFSLVRYNMRKVGIKVVEFRLPPQGKIGAILGVGFLAIVVAFSITSISAMSSAFDTVGFSLSNSWLMSQQGFSLDFPAYLSSIMVFWILIYSLNAFGETNFFCGVLPPLFYKHMTKSKTKKEAKTKHHAVQIGTSAMASIWHIAAYIPKDKLVTQEAIAMNFAGAFIFFYISLLIVEKLKSTSEMGFGHLITNLKIWNLI